jgi:carbamoyltransferase
MLRMAKTAHQITAAENLVLAGGVALNCVANGRLLREGPFKNIWIQPAAGDAGGALGVAQLIVHRHLGRPRALKRRGARTVAAVSVTSNLVASSINERSRAFDEAALRPYDDSEGAVGSVDESQYTDSMNGAYLGPEYSPEEIEQYLKSVGATYRRLERDELIDEVADLLANEKVIGWFNGRMEFGPRALGNRSIIGDARSPRMQAQMNLKIKFRESFRPFAPSVLRERVSDYFEMDCDSPYMLLVAPVKQERQIPMNDLEKGLWGIDQLNVVRSDIPAVTHIDYSARVQTVSRDVNADYYDLISAFEERTGCGVIVNTSFNVRGEPIVCTPADAYVCFRRTHIDYLVLGSFLLDKSEQSQWQETSDWRTQFQLD